MQRNVTLQDVASALGIHKSTVSLALSGKGNLAAETRRRIREKASQMGYEADPLAQRLADSSRSSLICLFSPRLDLGLATEKVLALQRGLSEAGFDAPIYTDVRQLRSIQRLRPRAIVCATLLTDSFLYDELQRYLQRGGILICYDTPVPLECDQILFDREHNAYGAAGHLLDLGHRAIGLSLNYPLDTGVAALSNPQAHRRRGFERALAERGLTLRPEWLFKVPPYEAGGVELARQYLDLTERPSAISIVNDHVALAFLCELKKVGVRLPEELSVVGHDNQSIAAYCPVPLTTMTQPVDRITEAVLERLKQRLEGDTSPPQQVVLRGELVVRQSAVPPR
jgi:DNA-binding LacI/PurR family transcriptional regulator